METGLFEKISDVYINEQLAHRVYRMEASLQSDITKPNIEVCDWLYQTRTHITHIVYQHFFILP